MMQEPAMHDEFILRFSSVYFTTMDCLLLKGNSRVYFIFEM